MSEKVLMLMMEPTPYITGLIHELRTAWHGDLEVVFVGRDLSQAWGGPGAGYEVLPAGLLRSGLSVFKKITSGRYSLIHLAGWGHPLLVLALLFGWTSGVPVTVESDTQLRPVRRGWRRHLKAVAYPVLFRIPEQFLPAGTRQAKYLGHFGVPHSRIRIAQMTVDVEAISAHRERLGNAGRRRLRDRLGLRDEQVAFLFVGRLEPHKGIRSLVDAYAGLDSAGKDGRALVIVGAGSLGEEVAGASRRVGGIIATGRLAGTDLLDIYCSADVFILPSTVEPWGLVVNEAMAARLPVIVTDAAGCVDDLVVEGGNGIIVRPGDVAGLREAMGRLESSPRMRESMAREAGRRIQSWTLQNEARKVAAAWSEVISS